MLSSIEEQYARQRREHWDQVALARGVSLFSQSYHQRLAEIYGFLVPEGARVLEIGCANGNLLAALKPFEGVGVDFSPAMIAEARARHPHLIFIEADAHALCGLEDKRFDYIILSDLVNDLWDLQTAFDQIRPLCSAGTRILLNFYSRIWQPLLRAAQAIGLAKPILEQNWLTVDDVSNILCLAGFNAIRSWQEVLLPLPVPLIAGFCNRFLVRLWPFNWMALSNFIVARPSQNTGGMDPERCSVSVVVPARNEAGNIPRIFERVPEMGAGTELVFVEGNSKDATYAVIQDEIAKNPQRKARLFKQDGAGKGDAVRKGFAHAEGDVLMILDADLTVPPEDLPRFYEAIVSNKGEFVNGVRLVYPMQKEAMRLLNFLGNKFFSLAFTWLLGQPIKDTLCGTKVLWRRDYETIAANRLYFGDFDPFGDFDLIFGAARLNLKILDLPIRYRERTYGATNISRWKHGLLLARMVVFAASRLKFI